MALVTDMTRFLPSRDPEEDVSAPDRRLGEYFGRIVEAATAGMVRGREQTTVVRCRRRPSRRPCAGRIEVLLTDVPSRIGWRCPTCGDQGVISKWRRTPWDLSAQQGSGPMAEVISVALPEEVHRVLDGVEWHDPDMARLVKGARADHEDAVIEGPAPLVGRLRDRVADEVDRIPSHRQRRLLGHAYFLLDIGCYV